MKTKMRKSCSVDKIRFWWGISQIRADRIDKADFCATIWYNLFDMGAT